MDLENGGGVKDWKAGSGSGAPKSGGDDGSAAAYQSVAAGASGGASASSTASTVSAEYAEDDKPTKADRRPWLFHLVMALGGLYMGMALTNWGSADA